MQRSILGREKVKKIIKKYEILPLPQINRNIIFNLTQKNLRDLPFFLYFVTELFFGFASFATGI